MTLAHLAAHDEAPRLRVTLKGRELYVYERTLGEGTIDAAPFLIARDEPKEAWVPLEPAGEVLLELRFRTGVTTAARLLRTASTPALDGPEQPRHQHLFRLASWGRPTWCAVCEGLMVRGRAGNIRFVPPRGPAAAGDDADFPGATTRMFLMRRRRGSS